MISRTQSLLSQFCISAVLLASTFAASAAESPPPKPPADKTPPKAPSDTPLAPRVVAVVDGRPITAADLSDFVRLAGIDPQRATRQEWLEALNAAIDRRVLVASARREKIEATDDEVDRAIAARHTAGESDEYNRRVKLLALTKEQEQAYMREQMLINRLVSDKLGAALFVSPAAALAWYEKNKDLLAAPEVRVARVITLNTKTPDTKEQMADIRKQLVAGGDFAEFARKHSTGPWAAGGGLMPPLDGPNCGNVFADRVFALKKPGDLSEPFETPLGLHILKLDEVRRGAVPTFREAQELVRERVLDGLRMKHIPALARELRQRSTIEIFWAELPGPKTKPQ